MKTARMTNYHVLVLESGVLVLADADSSDFIQAMPYSFVACSSKQQWQPTDNSFCGTHLKTSQQFNLAAHTWGAQRPRQPGLQPPHPRFSINRPIMNMNHVIKTFMHKTGVKIDYHIAKTAQLVEAAAPRPSFFSGGFVPLSRHQIFYPWTPPGLLSLYSLTVHSWGVATGRVQGDSSPSPVTEICRRREYFVGNGRMTCKRERKNYFRFITCDCLA